MTTEATDRTQQAAPAADVTLNGCTYRMAPLTDRDHAELDQYVRIEFLRAARASASPGASAEELDRIEKHAMAAATRMGWATNHLGVLDSVAGQARVLLQGFRRHHPELTAEVLSEAMRTDPAGVVAVWNVWRLLNIPTRSEDGYRALIERTAKELEEASGGGKKKASVRRRRR